MRVLRAGSAPAMFAAVAIVAGTAGSWAPGRPSGQLFAAPAAQPAAASSESVRGLLDRYCVSCHNEGRVGAAGGAASVLDAQLRATGLALDTVDAERPSADAERWERVIARLGAGTMPPAGLPRPGRDESRAAADWLAARIDEAAAANPDPGRTGSMHRLNRTEYGNAVRDLLALDVDTAALLPGDETSDTGFDNNAEVLSISTSQLERYLSAARKISRLATGVMTAPDFARFENSVLLTQVDRQSEDLPLGSRGGLAATYHFPADGNYIFRIGLTSNWQDYVRGMGRRNLLDLRIDGRLVERFTVGGEAPGTPAPHTWSPAEAGDPEWERYVRESAAHLEVRAEVEGGPHVVGVSFVRNRWEPEGPLQPVMKGAVLSNDEKYHGNAEVQALTIEGPYEGAVPDDTPSRRRIFVCRPAAASEEEGVRPPHPVAAGPPRLPPAARGRRRRDAARVLPGRAGEGRRRLRHRHSARPRAAARRSRLPPAGARGSARCRAGAGVPAARPRARLAPVVLPLEQHPRRGAARRGRARRADRPRRPARPGAAHARRPAERGAGQRLRGAVAAPSEPRRREGRARRPSRLRPGPGGGVPAGDGAVHRQHHRRGPERPRSPRRRLHVRERAAGAALRHSRGLRQPVPARDPARPRAAGRAAGPRVAAVADLLSAPDLARPAGAVAARGHLRGAAAGPAARRAGAARARGERRAGVDARTPGAAPAQPRVRELSPEHRPAGLHAGALRRHRAVADGHRDGSRGRRLRHPAERGDGAGPGRPAGPAARRARAVRGHPHRAAPRLRARARAAPLRPADGARDRPQRGHGRVPLVFRRFSGSSRARRS